MTYSVLEQYFNLFFMKNYTIKKIMATATPPFHSNAATAWSEQLSEHFKAQIVLYGAVESDPNPYMALYGKENNNLLKAAMERLQKLGSSLHQAHSVKYLMESGKNWRNLVKQMRDEHTDLLVAAMPNASNPAPGNLSILMYHSPCPTLFVREDMQPAMFKKILVPVRLKDGLEQKLPIVISLAKAHDAKLCFSVFFADNASKVEKTRLYLLVEKMASITRAAGISAEIETAHGFHFGTSMVQRAKRTGADLIAIAIEPSNFISRLFTKMVGPYFLENSPVPVLSVPLMKPTTALRHEPSMTKTSSRASSGIAVAAH